MPMKKLTAALLLCCSSASVMASDFYLHEDDLERFDEKKYTCKQLKKIAKKKGIIKISGGAIVAGSSLYCTNLDSSNFQFFKPDGLGFSAKDGGCSTFSCTGVQDNDVDSD